MGIIEDLINKLKQRQEQTDNLIIGLQKALDNANLTMETVQATLKVADVAINEINATIVEIRGAIVQIRTDYETLKKKVDDFINKPKQKTIWDIIFNR